jgi:Rha family phage regulatory protein
MYDLTIIKQNGGAYVDSREIANAIGKRHDNLLRDITLYLEILEKLADLNFEGCDFFVESSYFDPNRRLRLCYLVSKMGCEMIANKLTGERGILFTAAYVKKFNVMESAEREAEIKLHAKPRLGEFNSAVRNVLNGMAQCLAAPKRVMDFLQGVYKPLGIEVIPMNETDYYGYDTVTEIADKLGIYSESGKPHGHAVSAIISKIENHARHAIAIPYGLVGVTMRYDSHIVEAVRNWIAGNGFPEKVPHGGFDYHIYYERQLSLDEYDDGFPVDDSAG